jgi:hypothetical protein
MFRVTISYAGEQVTFKKRFPDSSSAVLYGLEIGGPGAGVSVFKLDSDHEKNLLRRNKPEMERRPSAFYWLVECQYLL